MPQWRKLHVKVMESLDVNDMADDFARLMWVLLPLVLDREGRMMDNVSLLRARLFPLRSDVTPTMIDNAMSWYAKRGMLRRYIVAERHYFHVPTFAKYQGKTDKEAASLYPEPPSEEVQTYSRPTPDLLQSESSTDADADAEEIQMQCESGPPSAVAATPPKPATDDSHRNVCVALENHFAELTKLRRPKLETERQRKAAAIFWFQPLRDIAEMAEWDESAARAIVSSAVQRLVDRKYTIASPNSILKTAIALGAEAKRDNGRGPPDGPSRELGNRTLVPPFGETTTDG